MYSRFMTPPGRQSFFLFGPVAEALGELDETLGA